MKITASLSISFLLALLGVTACGKSQDTSVNVTQKAASNVFHSTTGRWYTKEQIARGEILYQANCASCHKADASGTVDWKRLDAKGKLPPPPLNGTAHAWHHPLSVLRRTVRLGGVPLGGTMPGFAGKLDDREIDDILAWVQSHWSDEIYSIWIERDTQANRSLRKIN